MTMVTSLYVAIAALLLVILSVRVILGRGQARALIGDGGQETLARRIRAQGNFVEYTPIFLILLAMAEAEGMSLPALHMAGSIFMLGRVLHAYALSVAEVGQAAPSICRLGGMMATFSTLIVLSVYLLALYTGVL